MFFLISKGHDIIFSAFCCLEVCIICYSVLRVLYNTYVRAGGEKHVFCNLYFFASVSFKKLSLLPKSYHMYIHIINVEKKLTDINK